MASWWWILSALLLTSGVLGAPSDASEDYFYDEEEDEVASTHVPVFSSKSETHTIKEGANVDLPCFMDKATGVIIWQRGEDNIFTGDFSGGKGDGRYKLLSSGTKGNSLEILGVKPEDSGLYVCTVTSNPPVKLNHTLDVQYPPKVMTKPANGVMIIKQGSPASLSCSATGNPRPTITWTKKGGLLPNGEKKLQDQSVLAIEAVEKEHMGNYICTVDNRIGQAIVKTFRLEVNYPPEIEVMSSMVHTGAGYEAQLMCKVHGQPMPEVAWARSDGVALDPNHHVKSQEGDMHSISIDKVMDSDMGTYMCRAASQLGTANAQIQVTGKPKPVKITSNPNGNQATSYTMDWMVESYAPIEEYKVIHKLTEENGNAVTSQQWEEAVFAPTGTNEDNSVVYKYTHTLGKLKNAAVYEAIVTARNKYGWSAEPSKPFTLSTQGAQALGSKDPNAGSAALRSGLTACLAVIVALFFSL